MLVCGLFYLHKFLIPNSHKLFNIQKDTKSSFRYNFKLSPRVLNEIKVGEKQSFILLYNTQVNKANENNALLIMYAVVQKNDNCYTVRVINWLNWLHGISSSLENSYSLISKFNNNTKQTDFTSLSDAACYKALYPLLTYLPNKLSNGVTPISLFEIMRVFVKQREINFSRDYARNIYSRVRTSLRKEYGHNNTNVIDLIKNDELVKINFDGEILIPNTTLEKNIMYPIEHDSFLMSIIDAIPSTIYDTANQIKG